MSSPNNMPTITTGLQDRAALIEAFLASYANLEISESALPYLASYSSEVLSLYCPDALELQAAFIVDEQSEEAFLGIHLAPSLIEVFNAFPVLSELLSNRSGLNAFMALAEEISHFHQYLSVANSNKKISRFDLELQAEIDKVIIGALALSKAFGNSYVEALVKILFDEAIFNSSLTNYQQASKIAEKFWKEHLRAFGPGVIFDQRFRIHLQKATRLTGAEKRRMLDQMIRAA